MQNFEDSFFLALALCGVIGSAAAWLAFRRRDRGPLWHAVSRPLIRPTGLAMSLAAIVAFTVYTPHFGDVWEARLDQGISFNGSFVPFRTIGSYLASTPSLNIAMQLLGNVLLFMPLGFFLAFDGVLRPSSALISGLVGALLVEVWQALTGRTTDIDDVILNGVGVALGVALAALIMLIRRRRRSAGRQVDLASP